MPRRRSKPSGCPDSDVDGDPVAIATSELVSSREVAALRADTRDWWADMLAREPDELEEGEEPVTADEVGLRHFLEGTVMPWFGSAGGWRVLPAGLCAGEGQR